MANSYDIEAKLCAYIEGDLDEAGRVEIEKHLQSNPQHRRLIEELAQVRRLTQALPRAKAPGDIADGLQGTMERNMLLGAEGQADLTPRRRVMPQMLAVAAGLVLASGLAVGAYFVLRSSFGGPHITSVAGVSQVDAQKTADSTTAPSAPAGTTDEAGKPAVAAPAPMVMPAPPSPATEPPMVAALPPAVVPPVVVPPAAPAVVEDEPAAVKTNLIAGTVLNGVPPGGAAQAPQTYDLCLVLSTSNPDVASAQVATELDQEHLAYVGGGENLSGVRGGGGGGGGAMHQLQNNAVTAGNTVNGANGAGPNPADALANGSTNSMNTASNYAPVVEAQVLPQSIDRDRAMRSRLGGEELKNRLGESTAHSFVVSNISRQQVDQLAQNLGLRNPDLGYDVHGAGLPDNRALGSVSAKSPTAFAFGGGAGGGGGFAEPTTSPAVGLMDKLDTSLVYQPGDLVNVEFMTWKDSQAVTRSAETAVVSAGGELKLDSMATIPAAGKTNADLEKSIVQGYQQAHPGAAFGFSLRRVAPVFADSTIASPTTQPAEAEQRVNLVLIVEPAAPATQPATQPVP